MSNSYPHHPITEGLISIVLPVHNESAGIETFHNHFLLPAINENSGNRFEVIYIDDGSTDSSLHQLTLLARSDSRIRVVSLSRNFGKEIATTAGLSVAQGAAIVIMDSDGQHPPSILNQFIDKWTEGAQVVVGVRQSNQKEGLAKRLGSKMFYRLLNSISDIEDGPAINRLPPD